MPGTPTPIYDLVVPTVTGDSNAWGGELNTDLASLDTIIGLPRCAQSALGNQSGSVGLNLSVANFFSVTATGSINWTFTNVPTGPGPGPYENVLVLHLTNGGAFSMLWGASVTWLGSGNAPSLQVSGTDVLVFWTNNAGTTWFGTQMVVPGVSGAPKTLFMSAQATGTGGVDVSLVSYSVPANTLTTAGQKLRIEFGGNFINQIGGGTGIINILFGGTQIGTASVIANCTFHVVIEFVYLSGSTQIAYMTFVPYPATAASLGGPVVTRISPIALTLTSAQLLDFHATPNSASTGVAYEALSVEKVSST